MKRYLVFLYANYYPSGGWHDFDAAYDTLEEAMAAPTNNIADGCIVDTTTMEIVKELFVMNRTEPRVREWRDVK